MKQSPRKPIVRCESLCFLLAFYAGVTLCSCRPGTPSNERAQPSLQAEDAAAMVIDASPEVDDARVPEEIGRACQREHCYTGGAAACLERCYRYNHPRDPEAHDVCDQGCRKNYDLDTCERLCHTHPMAFEIPAGHGSCKKGLIGCRRDCEGKSGAMRCEESCLTEYDLCEDQ